jgi:hypothetical protein
MKKKQNPEATFFGGVVEGSYMTQLPERQKNGINVSVFKLNFSGLSGICT